MIDKLHELDFRVTTWVTPFINPTSKNYKPGDESRYFLINGNRNVSSLIPWWNGLGSSVDFSNDDACDWLVENACKKSKASKSHFVLL